MDSITRQGINDIVWHEGEVCLWVRNGGELLVLTADPDVSDEELIKKFTAYLKWRKLQPPLRTVEGQS
jgi:hypothetical protein